MSRKQGPTETFGRQRNRKHQAERTKPQTSLTSRTYKSCHHQLTKTGLQITREIVMI
uniref:Uncharacterized protein n=1 Tax=Anguilla anguilla TaxID=7936 RepID=A0A0E9XE64_ANGAN